MIRILAIESSCDETAASVIEDGWKVKSNVISSQIALHQKYGGVVPEIASRKHIENIDFVIEEAMNQSGLSFQDMDAIAVTYGPGLVGALLVGLSAAKALAYATGKPLVGVNHIEGHICANYIENKDFKPPFICLVVSGGHTFFLHVKEYGTYEVLGRTRDDAAGEAYDKVARALGLGYPGGPKIDLETKSGNPGAIVFPRAFIGEEHLDVSFSGLKSSVLNYLNKSKMTGQEIYVPDVAASFQEAVIDVLVTKTMEACSRYGVNKVAMAGGVASNLGLRDKMQRACDTRGYGLNIPSIGYCTDNAAMIGAAGYFSFLKGKRDNLALNAVPGLQLNAL